jgi:hypothetical protein
MFSETAARQSGTNDGRVDQSRVVHKIFEDCVALTSDTYWKDKLTQASRGKFPTGFTYKDGLLSFKKKNKPKPVNQSISFDPAIAVNEFISFMQLTGKYSDTNMVSMNNQSQISQSQTAQLGSRSWTSVHKKSRRDYVERFISYVITAYKLNPAQIKSLRECIQIGIMLGAFGTNNIKVVGNRIESIVGIVTDPTTGLFIIDGELLKDTYKSIAKATSKPEVITHISIYEPDTINATKIIDSMIKDYDKAKAFTGVKDLFISPSMPSVRSPLIVIED